MSLRLIVREAFDRKLADVDSPSLDLDAVRRAGRRPRRIRALIGSVVLLLLGILAFRFLTAESQEPPAAVDPGTVPVMNFAGGIRAFYEAGQMHLGGRQFPAEQVRDLDAAATPTLYGLVFFAPDQAVRILTEAGEVQTLAQPPTAPVAFHQTVGFDYFVPLLAWTTRTVEGVTVTVYRYGEQQGTLGRYPVPCSGEACDAVEVAAVDAGLVYVRGADGSRVIDSSLGGDAAWSRVTDGQITDVRNRVILTHGASSSKVDPTSILSDAWTIAEAASPDSQLTFEGARQTDGTSTLKPTLANVAPLTMGLPAGGGDTVVRLDSDGSLLIGRADPDGDRYWDCDLLGTCFEVGFVAGANEPRLVGP